MNRRGTRGRSRGSGKPRPNRNISEETPPATSAPRPHRNASAYTVAATRALLSQGGTQLVKTATEPSPRKTTEPSPRKMTEPSPRKTTEPCPRQTQA